MSINDDLITALQWLYEVAKVDDDKYAAVTNAATILERAREQVKPTYRDTDQPVESPYKTVSGKPSYIRLTDDLDHAYSQWFNSHGTARHKLVEGEFLFWCSANLHHYRNLKLPMQESSKDWPDLQEEVQDVLTWAHNLIEWVRGGISADDGATVPVKSYYLRYLTEAVEKLRKAKSSRALNYLNVKVNQIEDQTTKEK